MNVVSLDIVMLASDFVCDPLYKFRKKTASFVNFTWEDFKLGQWLIVRVV